MKRIIITIVFVFLTAAIIHAQNKTLATQYANTTLSNLLSPAMNVSLLPDKNNNHNIGNLTKGWKNLYLDSAVYIDSSRFIAFATGSGSGNTAIGKNALQLDISGSSNTCVGYKCLYYNQDGSENTAMGRGALYQNTEGGGNTGIGYHSLYTNTSGNDNVAVGHQSLVYNSTGAYNTASGSSSLYYNTTGSDNTAYGASALNYNTNGTGNTANGVGALRNATTGDDNAAYGFIAGASVTNGSNNTFIGSYSDGSSGGHITNSTALGYDVTITANNTVRIGNSSVTSIGGYTNWSNISDGRIKKNIKQNVPGLSFINKLQPVTYNLDLDVADKIINKPTLKNKDGKVIQPSQTELNTRKAKEQIVYTGFVAQNVEKAAQSLNYDFSGVDKPDNANTLYGLRYSDFVVPLVKGEQELSKENDSLKSEIRNLKSEIENIKAMLAVNQYNVNSQQSTVLSSATIQQNIPNPFSNSTSISYSLPQAHSSAKIIITDKAGKALKEINLPANKGYINIDAATLSSGAYQYSLYVDEKRIASKQMEILK